MLNEFNELYELLTEYEVATEEELQLVFSINGQTLEQLENILYYKTGLRSLEQLKDDLGLAVDPSDVQTIDELKEAVYDYDISDNGLYMRILDREGVYRYKISVAGYDEEGNETVEDINELEFEHFIDLAVTVYNYDTKTEVTYHQPADVSELELTGVLR